MKLNQLPLTGGSDGKRRILLLSMRKRTLKPQPMAYMAQEFLDLLFWKLHRILEREGISMLHWAIMQRAFLAHPGVANSVVMKATGDSKDNVRRAAKFLQESNLGNVVVNPCDRRARIFSLTKRGREHTLRIQQAFEAELLNSMGAREIFSQRVKRFNLHMWRASGYLTSGDLANGGLIDLRMYNRAAMPDDSLRYVELPKRIRALFTEPEKVPF